MKDREAYRLEEAVFKAAYGIERPKDLKSLRKLYGKRRDLITPDIIKDGLWGSVRNFIEIRKRSTPKASTKHKPPQPYPAIRIERLLHLLIKFEDREIIDGDLYEEYDSNLNQHSRRYADLHFYKRVAHSLWPLLKERMRAGVMRWLGKIFKHRSS